MKSKIIYYIIAALLLSIMFTGLGLADVELLPDPDSSGYITATSTHFELNNTKYPDLTIDSSNPVNLTLKSEPEMVQLRFDPINTAPVTNITLTGLTPLTTYYKFEDDYHNQVDFTTDSSGRYTYTQDNTKKHYVFILPESGNMTIQSGPNIKFINDNATGGDCTSIGNWDPGTKTCTLTTDFSGTIQIDSDVITLDGSGHTLTGSDTGNGVFINSSGFTIKDLEIYDFANGIFCKNYFLVDSGHENHITDNIIFNNDEGISFCDWSRFSKTIIKGNTISDNDHGIFLHYSSRNITIIDNIIKNNRWGIASFDQSNAEIVTNNEIYNNFIGILMSQGDCENITKNNIFNNSGSGITIDMTGSIDIKDNNISKNQYGISLGFMTGSNDITGNTISNNDFGIHMGDEDEYSDHNSRNNHIIGNTVSNNNYGFYIFRAYDNFFYHNNVINNTNNAYEYLETGSNDWDDGTLGNYWSNYDEPCEGCIDEDNNNICDVPYSIPGGSGIDHYPMVHWITTNGPNIKFINDNATGGDCNSIGNWDPGTKTCTLTTDFNGTIQINSDDMTLDGDGYSSDITNGFDGVSGFTIENFVNSSIYIRSHGHQTNSYSFIKNNILTGITLRDSRNITIANNIISHNNGSGIYMHTCRDFINITENIINNNTEVGIEAWDGGISCITGNMINNNNGGIRLIQTECDDIINNNICNNINVGISLDCLSNANNIIDNNILNNEKGIYIYNSESGITNCKIINNNISNNNYGVDVNVNGCNIHVYQNNLINNIINNACDYSDSLICSNQWDNGSIGNYWSNYDEPCEGCIDEDNNNICDVPYSIPGGSGIDHYPMVHWITPTVTPTDTQPGPTEIPEFPTLLLPITAILGLMFWFARKT